MLAIPASFPRRPTLTTIHAFVTTHNPDGTSLISGRLNLDTQAHLYVSLLTPHGQALIPQHGSRVGWWLNGPPAKTLQTLQLQPGTFPIRLRIPTRQLAAAGNYTLRLVAIDPDGRHVQLLAPLSTLP